MSAAGGVQATRADWLDIQTKNIRARKHRNSVNIFNGYENKQKHNLEANI